MTVAFPEHQRLMKFLHDRQGHVFNGVAQGVAVKRMLAEGFTPDECEACFDYLANQSWRDTAVTWTVVAREISQWLQRQEQQRAKSRIGEWDGVETVKNEFEGMTQEEITEHCRRQLGYYRK